MLQRVEMDGIEFPKLYIAENNRDVDIAMRNGIPFIKWNKGIDKLISYVLRPTLEKMFPSIDWNKVLGPKHYFKTDVQIVEGGPAKPIDDLGIFDNQKMLEAQYEYDKHVDELCHDLGHCEEVSDIADSKREFSNQISNEERFVKKLDIYSYIGDVSSNIDLSVLQKLNLLPKFVGNVIDCIKVNLSNSMNWTEGYTKKLGAPLGNFSSKKILPNLIILDISGSIPRGISATMLTLIDTMRKQVNADLIITADRSMFYSADDKLPDPQTLRDYFGYGNEAAEFYSILDQYVIGREWGHVISFGDNDCPADFNNKYCNYGGVEADVPELTNTKVHQVHHYHTRRNICTGYAKWCHMIPDIGVSYDTSWCNVIL